MGDRISDLPDDVLCYILCFLPTKVTVATSVLSKRWKHLWRSVPTLYFDGFYDDYLYSDVTNFIESINAFLLSPHRHQCFQNLRLASYDSGHIPSPLIVSKRWTPFYESIVTFIAASVQHRFQHVDLRLYSTTIPSVMLSCKTLVVFKLRGTKFEAFSSVDLPSLKILHLNQVTFQEYRHVAELLSGCPKLEDLEAIDLPVLSYVIQPKFKNLSKLISVSMDRDIIPLQVVHSVQFLRIEWTNSKEITQDLTTLEFHNLSRVEFRIWGYTNNWLNIFKVLEHCPKLQNLVIHKLDALTASDIHYGEECSYPLSVPKCISSHLKTCRINFYRQTDFEFTRYIMQNARRLHDMAIGFHFETTERERCEIIKKLCFCTRLSSICKLTFSLLEDDADYEVDCTWKVICVL